MYLFSSDRARFDGARPSVLPDDLGDTAVRDEELPGDDARPDPHEGQLHYTSSHIVRERTTTDEDSSKLIDSFLTFTVFDI